MSKRKNKFEKSTDKSNDPIQRDKVVPLKDVKNLNPPNGYEAYLNISEMVKNTSQNLKLLLSSEV